MSVDGDVVNPRLEALIKEFSPFVVGVVRSRDMKDERITEEKMLESKTRRHAAKIEKIFELAVVFQTDFIGWLWNNRRKKYTIQSKLEIRISLVGS